MPIVPTIPPIPARARLCETDAQLAAARTFLGVSVKGLLATIGLVALGLVLALMLFGKL